MISEEEVNRREKTRTFSLLVFIPSLVLFIALVFAFAQKEYTCPDINSNSANSTILLMFYSKDTGKYYCFAQENAITPFEGKAYSDEFLNHATLIIVIVLLCWGVCVRHVIFKTPCGDECIRRQNVQANYAQVPQSEGQAGEQELKTNNQRAI